MFKFKTKKKYTASDTFNEHLRYKIILARYCKNDLCLICNNPIKTLKYNSYKNLCDILVELIIDSHNILIKYIFQNLSQINILDNTIDDDDIQKLYMYCIRNGNLEGMKIFYNNYFGKFPTYMSIFKIDKNVYNIIVWLYENNLINIDNYEPYILCILRNIDKNIDDNFKALKYIIHKDFKITKYTYDQAKFYLSRSKLNSNFINNMDKIYEYIIDTYEKENYEKENYKKIGCFLKKK